MVVHRDFLEEATGLLSRDELRVQEPVARTQWREEAVSVAKWLRVDHCTVVYVYDGGVHAYDSNSEGLCAAMQTAEYVKSTLGGVADVLLTDTSSSASPVRLFRNEHATWSSTVTFANSTESFAGMHINGLQRTSGYTHAELNEVVRRFGQRGCAVEDLDLGRLTGTSVPGRVVVVRNAFRDIADAVAVDLEDVVHPRTDRQALMRNKLLTRRARYCACLGNEAVEADLANGVGVVVPFKDTPAIQALRERIGVCERTRDLLAEVNYYFDHRKCYIGFHGDSERPDVIGCVLGASKNLHFQGFRKAIPEGERVTVKLHHGDLYIGCESAFGFHWSKLRASGQSVHYRHAAGNESCTAIKDNTAITAAKQRKRVRSTA